MTSTFKNGITNSHANKNTFFSIDRCSCKIPSLNIKKKLISRKMVTSISAEYNVNHSHHVISYDSGYTLCEIYGETIRRIYQYESNPAINNICYHRFLDEYPIYSPIHSNLLLISLVISKLELYSHIFYRSLYLFKKVLKIIDFRKGMLPLYALNCIFYSSRENNRFISSNNLLGLYYEINKPDLYKNFYQVYDDLTKKIGLKKIFLKPDDFLLILFDKFHLNRESLSTVKLILSQIMKFLPYGKRMNKGIAASVFYIGSKMNNIIITQEEIAEALEISRSTVYQYTSEVKKILSFLYFKNKKNRITNKQLIQLKRHLKKKHDGIKITGGIRNAEEKKEKGRNTRLSSNRQSKKICY